jgi:hypothetical protein
VVASKTHHNPSIAFQSLPQTSYRTPQLKISHPDAANQLNT